MKKIRNIVFFPASHPRVTDSIVAGSVDGGATYDYNFTQAVIKHGNVFKVIVESPPMPTQAFMAHPSLPDSVCDGIQRALPTINPSLLEGLDRYGYIIRQDSYYDLIRLMIEQSEKAKGN
ncbi:MAG: PhnD/SsuA/transferrin family substrate-binding protein [Spirochaetales bacterium]|nr:PhnD/SsuA/transferrin family substrate-binding protein [Spirochaetales bacterium]